MMMMRFDNVIFLSSGNTARGFNVRDLGNGRVHIQYNYTDRRRNHQTARRFTAEFLNGRLVQIIARSARGGRVEIFHGSMVMDVLEEIVKEVARINAALTNFRKDVAEMRTTETPVETKKQDDTSDILDTLKTVGTMVAINLMVTLVTIGIVWYNL